MKFLYLGHPARGYDGDLGSIAEACALEPAGHGNWVLRCCPYDVNASLNARDFCSQVLQSPGPVLLLRPVQSRTLELIRQKLSGRVPVEVQALTTTEELQAAVFAIGKRFDGGEPFLPLDLVVALLMLRKLDKEHMWGGNAKGYMWVDDIPKGRGLDEKYAARVPHVLNILYQHDLLIQKKSQTSKKYALNPAFKDVIFEALRDRWFPEDVLKPLIRCGAEETIRSLDVLEEYSARDA